MRTGWTSIDVANDSPVAARCDKQRPQRSRSSSPAVIDPVHFGLVDSLARPGGNVTGFIISSPTWADKWLELLQGAVPSIDASRRSPIPTIRNDDQFSAVFRATALAGFEICRASCGMPAEIERRHWIRAQAGYGLIVCSGSLTTDLASRRSSRACRASFDFPSIFHSGIRRESAG